MAEVRGWPLLREPLQRRLSAAGDVVSALDQIAVATGHGAIAAVDIHNLLRG